MDLLGEEKKKTKKTKGQKIVLVLLIISIVLCLAIGGIMFYLWLQGENREYTLAINGRLVSADKIGVFVDENDKEYIALRNLATELGYKYYNGKFKTEGEETSNAY